ncbi:MAG: adenosylcobalamin-dependent ribonucleoside-diphosphate reductase, partial [Patescibacteria group bacterium]
MAQVAPTTIIDEPIPALARRGRPVKTIGDDLPQGQWSEQAVKVLRERYLLKNERGEVIETPDQMCWRVAYDIALAEKNFGKTDGEVTEVAREYYKLLVTHEFLPNSPTLMNAGKNNGLQYSACFVLPIEDSIEGIFDGIKWTAIIHKSGGGTGFSFSRLRQSGAIVGSTRGVASGPVSFMKIYDAATEQVKQGGSRRGANMGILRVDHPDVLDFIHCKESGGITNFNISVAATDVFMEAYAQGKEYDLLDPKTKRVIKKLDARKVMREIAQGAWETGDPGMVFIDRMNAGSGNPVPSLGPIESTNPCGEQQLYPFDVCNLGSIFLTYFIRPATDGSRQVDWEKLEKTTKLAVRFLDSVIERNPYPLPQIREMAHKIRRIGLGVGGWADMLVQLGISYDSQEAIDLAEKVMRFINEKGHEASQELVSERGVFPAFGESIYKDDRPIRNSTVTTIAPTGTIAIIANSSTGIEPYFAIAFKHYVKT